MSMSSSSSRLVSLVAVALALSALGCAKDAAHEASPSQESAAMARASEAPAAPAGGAAGAAADARPLAPGRALAVTLDLSVVARDPDGLSARVRDDVERAGGYVASASSTGSGESRTARLELRVPADRTRGLRALLADAGQIVQDSERSEDVTEQRADLEARLRNARAQEKRTLEIMAQRTGSLGELLDVERELARVRETIERFEAQKRALDGRIELTTVHLTLSTKPIAAAEKGALASIRQAAAFGLHATGTLLLYAAMALAASSPVLVPFGLVAWTVALVVRRRRRAELDARRAAAGAAG